MMKDFVYGLPMAVMNLLVVFGLFEIYVRITQTDVANFDIEMWLYVREMKQVNDVPGMGHEHVLHQSRTYMGVSISINSVGWRDEEYPLEKLQDTERIMMLGDSLTLGWGTPLESVTSTVLENLLNESGVRKYKVLNTGVDNANTAMQTAYFLHEGFRFQPDIAVLNYFINDAELPPTRTENFLVEHSYAAVFLSGRLNILMRTYWGQDDWRAYYRNLYDDNQSGWRNTTQAFGKLARFCRERGIDLLVANYPELHQLIPYPFQDIMNLIADQVKAHDISFYDLLLAVEREEPRSLWVNPTDAHPNGKAGRLFAARLRDCVRTSYPVKGTSNFSRCPTEPFPSSVG